MKRPLCQAADPALRRIATISPGAPYPRPCATCETSYLFNSHPFHRLEMCGDPHEQYSIQSSNESRATGTRYDPFPYGLNPTRYRVRHFGHSTQCRTRAIGDITHSHLNEIHRPKLDVPGHH